MILVKLGGSVITTKGGAKRVRRPVLLRLARELRGAEKEGLAVLHGAGSFGHTLARRAKLKEGLQRTAQRPAASQVAADVRALHLEVLRALQAAKLAPFSLPPGQLGRASGGELVHLDLAPYRLALQHGFVPVGCGDVVLDDKQGVAIVSADVLGPWLARELGATRMVFATDVDGIYTAPPGTRGAELVARCTPEELRNQVLGGARGADVTGGMAGKGKAIAAMAEAGIEVCVVNGLEPGRLRAAVQGKPGVGTVVARGA